MNYVQVLQNTAARIILNMPKNCYPFDAFEHLGWENMTRRRFHHLILIFKVFGFIDWDFNFYTFKDI